MKNLLFLLTSCLFILNATAQTSERWGFNNVPDHSTVNQMSGPRFGFSYLSQGSTSQYLNRLHEMDSFE